jgi:hypothetical protein
MAKKAQKKRPQDQRPQEKKKARPVEPAGFGFTRTNYILFAVALGVIALGYVFLGTGDIVIAPILLVGGYVVLVPLSILFRKDWKIVQKLFGPKAPAAPAEPKEPNPQST